MSRTCWFVASVLAFPICLGVASPSGLAANSQQNEPPSLDEVFAAAAEKNDEAAIDAAFKGRPYEVIYVVDGLLESWLAQVEGSAQEKVEKPEALLERALLAAKHGDKAFATDAYSRYANAWKGWSEEQRKQFRQGQQEFGAARQAAKEKKLDEAKTHYEASLKLAEPLGDLWGIAQAHQGLGDLAMGTKNYDAAIKHHEEGAKIFGSLRHSGMLRSHRALAIAYEAKKDLKSARMHLETMVRVAEEAGRPEAATPVKADLVRICRELGDEEAAKKYEAASPKKDG